MRASARWPCSGRFQDRIAPAEAAALVGMFERADFLSLRDEYIGEITDSPFYSVSLTIDGGIKKVTDYVGKLAGMPDVITDLEGAIDRAAETAKYVKGTPETMPMLRRTGFDFTSSRAATFLADALEIRNYAYASDLISAGAPLNGRTSSRNQPAFELLFLPRSRRDRISPECRCCSVKPQPSEAPDRIEVWRLSLPPGVMMRPLLES